MLNDLFVLTKIKEGNVKAFEGIFRLYYSPLCLYAAGITGSMDVAEEIVQELFYVFWKEKEKLQVFRSLKSYLYGAVRNQSLQYCEHQEVRNRYRENVLSGNQASRSAGPTRIQRTGSSDKQDSQQAARTPFTHLPDAAFRR